MEYSPVKNIYGELVDSVLKFDENEGIKCQCSNSVKIYKSKKSFVKHLQSMRHKKWLETENLKLKINDLENEIYYRYKENYDKKEELWYNEMYPNKEDISLCGINKLSNVID